MSILKDNIINDAILYFTRCIPPTVFKIKRKKKKLKKEKRKN